jgi:hypothetical protein
MVSTPPRPRARASPAERAACVGAQADHPQLRPVPAQPGEDDGRRVRAAVVDDEHLVAAETLVEQAVEHGTQPLRERGQHLGLVEGRHHHGQGDLGGALGGRHAVILPHTRPAVLRAP